MGQEDKVLYTNRQNDNRFKRFRPLTVLLSVAFVLLVVHALILPAKTLVQNEDVHATLTPEMSNVCIAYF